jgi:hypothetical protein
MAAKLTILNHKIEIQLHLVAESCTICSSRSRRLVRKLLDTPSYILTYACLAREFGAGSCILELQRLQNKFLRTSGSPLRITTPTSDMHMAFKIPYIYDFVTKLCRQQAIVTLNHENVKISKTGQGEARHRKYKKRSGNYVDSGYILVQYINIKYNLL